MARRQRWTDSEGRTIDEEDRGLGYDVETLVSRRRALGLFGALGAGALVAGCGGTTSGSSQATSATTSAAAPSSAASKGLSEVPDETAGPYPGDGTNGPDVLDDSGIVRSDIRSSFGSGDSSTAAGIALTVRLTVRDASSGDARKGAAVYLWHCDRDGQYSLYADGLESVSYLRGVQAADSSGTVQFRTIFPAAYDGRWPHIHFEVYGSLSAATSDGPIVKTSQIALPKEACEAVYATDGYESSVENLSRTSLSQDMVFGDDGGIHQLASVSGSARDGYAAALTIGV